MAGAAERRSGTGLNIWRVAGWGAAGALLLAPLIAMRFTRQVNWTPSDFAVMGAMLAAVGLAFEFLARQAAGAYRLAAALALLAAFLLVWINLAVGIIGSEHNPANLMFAGVLAVAIGGAVAARFRAGGMARAMAAAAVGQVTVGAVALAGGLGAEGHGWPWDVVGATAVLGGVWLASAGLFAWSAVPRTLPVRAE